MGTGSTGICEECDVSVSERSLPCPDYPIEQASGRGGWIISIYYTCRVSSVRCLFKLISRSHASRGSSLQGCWKD